MKPKRFIVTLTTLLTLAACHKSSKPHAVGPATAALQNRQAVEVSGNAKIQKAYARKAELLSKYGINLDQATSAPQDAKAYNWSLLSKNERREARAKLAEFVSLVSGVLEIDAQNNFYVTRKDEIVHSRDRAFAFQQSIEGFEKKFGENFEPKAAK
jgi:hypothetical protein